MKQGTMWIVVIWWLWMQAIGLAALPLAYRFFRRLPDRGYAFARPLGLLLTSYVLWLGSSFGLLRNSAGGAVFSLLLVAAVSLVVYRRGRREGEPGLLAWLRAHRSLVLIVELLFGVALALWSLIRAYSPELTTAGGEKFMEIMFLNSIGRSDYFPPHDAWLSGYGISYYYFGYVMVAMLTRLSGFPAHLTFNVGLALLFALTCTGAFGVVFNLVALHRRPATKSGRANTGPASAFGILGAFLVAVMGNLEGFLEVLYSARVLPVAFWRWLDILDLNEPYDSSTVASWVPVRSGWWWWRASRVINDLDPQGASMGIQPIDEFPGFSFLLGDMHPHVLALPFVLLALGVALNALLQAREAQDSETRKGWWAPVPRLPLLVPLCLGGLGFLNTWDFPIYLAVFTGAYGLGRRDHYGHLSWGFLRDVALTGITAAALGFVLYLPFYLGFQSQAGGILPTLYVGTRFRQYFVMFGPFLVALAGLLALLAVEGRGRIPAAQIVGRWAGWTAALFVLPLALMLLGGLALVLTEQGRAFLEGVRRVPAVYAIVGDANWPVVMGRLLLVKLRTWVMPFVVATLSGLGLSLLAALRGSSKLPGTRGEQREVGSEPAPLDDEGESVEGSGASAGFVLLCAVAGLLLTLSVEYFYLMDNFMVRMNTIFKFYFQAWVLMAIASAFAVYFLGRAKGSLRTAFLAGFWLLFGLGMVYPVLGNISRAGNFAHPPTLDGTAYLAESQPDDYQAIRWLNENVDGAPVILEVPATGGNSYVYEGRVSALTGLPTLLGWGGHEGQWRGDYTVQSAREPDIETLYTTRDTTLALTLMDKYDITYVYVGPLERSRYDARSLDKFGQFMKIVYQQGAVTIYRR